MLVLTEKMGFHSACAFSAKFAARTSMCLSDRIRALPQIFTEYSHSKDIKTYAKDIKRWRLVGNQLTLGLILPKTLKRGERIKQPKANPSEITRKKQYARDHQKSAHDFFNRAKVFLEL